MTELPLGQGEGKIDGLGFPKLNPTYWVSTLLHSYCQALATLGPVLDGKQQKLIYNWYVQHHII